MSEAAVNKSIDNGFTRTQHYAAVSDIDYLFKKSVKLWERPDKYGNLDVVAIHRFAAQLFGNNVAFITVKEVREHGKKIYTAELIEIGKLEGKLEEAKSNLTTFPTSSFPVNNIQK